MNGEKAVSISSLSGRYPFEKKGDKAKNAVAKNAVINPALQSGLPPISLLISSEMGNN